MQVAHKTGSERQENTDLNQQQHMLAKAPAMRVHEIRYYLHLRQRVRPVRLGGPQGPQNAKRTGLVASEWVAALAIIGTPQRWMEMQR